MTAVPVQLGIQVHVDQLGVCITGTIVLLSASLDAYFFNSVKWCCSALLLQLVVSECAASSCNACFSFSYRPAVKQ